MHKKKTSKISTENTFKNKSQLPLINFKKKKEAQLKYSNAKINSKTCWTDQ